MVVYHDRNLIINYIPRNLSDIDLSTLFASVGPIKTCRIIRDRNSGSSYGFGFCEYEDASSAHKAIERFNGYRIVDKVLKVSMAKLQGRLSQSSNLYVKNLPHSVTDDELLTEFSRFGKVTQCRILRDRDSNKSNGSAYVLYEKRPDAENAKRMLDNTQWPNHTDILTLSIKFATPPYRQPSGLNSIKHMPTSVGMMLPIETDINGSERLLALLSEWHKIRDQGVALDPQYFQDGMYINAPQNIPGHAPVSVSTQSNIMWSPDYPTDSQPITANQYPLAATYVAPYYFAQPQTIANFWPSFSPLSGQTAFGAPYMNQIDGLSNAVHGCPIFTGLPTPLFSAGNHLNGTSRFSVPGIPGTDLGSKKYKMNKFDKMHSTSVYVYNIGNLMTESRMLELFGRFGVILNVSIPKDPKTNFARNFGFITFNSVQSAQSAISAMNGYTYSGRRLQVSLRKPRSGSFKSFANSSKATDSVDTPHDADNSKVSTDSGSVQPDNDDDKGIEDEFSSLVLNEDTVSVVPGPTPCAVDA